MAAKKVTVVIAQSPGKNPVKRNVEETIAATLLLDTQVEVSLVPHLYDLTPDDLLPSKALLDGCPAPQGTSGAGWA